MDVLQYPNLLNDSKRVMAIIGTMTLPEAGIVSAFGKTSNQFPIISLPSPAMMRKQMLQEWPYFIQMASDITLHMKSPAAILGKFRWRKSESSLW